MGSIHGASLFNSRKKESLRELHEARKILVRKKSCTDSLEKLDALIEFIKNIDIGFVELSESSAREINKYSGHKAKLAFSLNRTHEEKDCVILNAANNEITVLLSYNGNMEKMTLSKDNIWELLVSTNEKVL